MSPLPFPPRLSPPSLHKDSISTPQCRPQGQLGHFDRIQPISRHLLRPHLSRMHLVNISLRNRIIRRLRLRLRKRDFPIASIRSRSIPWVYEMESEGRSYRLGVAFAESHRRSVQCVCMEPSTVGEVFMCATNLVAAVPCYPWFSVVDLVTFDVGSDECMAKLVKDGRGELEIHTHRG